MNPTREPYIPPSLAMRRRSSAVTICACSIRGLDEVAFLPPLTWPCLPSIMSSKMSSTSLFARSPTQCIFWSGLHQILLRERQQELTDDLPPVVVQSFDESFELLWGMAHHAILGRLIMIRCEQGSTPKIKRACSMSKY